jgi:hypothetical protein
MWLYDLLLYTVMGGAFFQFVDQMLTKNRILGLFKISKFIA